MTVSELKSELDSRNADSTGLKNVLQDRLISLLNTSNNAGSPIDNKDDIDNITETPDVTSQKDTNVSGTITMEVISTTEPDLTANNNESKEQ
jgi:hypothetical protein